jgi:hypothetical protein
VRVDGVDKRVDERRLMWRLGDTYRPLLHSGQLSIRLGAQDVKPPPLEVERRHQFTPGAMAGRLDNLFTGPLVPMWARMRHHSRRPFSYQTSD